METICTLEAVKTCGEVHSPVAGEVLEVNTRPGFLATGQCC